MYYVKRGLISIPKVVGISLSIHQFLLHPPGTGLATKTVSFLRSVYQHTPGRGKGAEEGPTCGASGLIVG